jgi:hypothetical protein
MSTAALRAPVLLVRLRPAPRPGRSTRAPRARCRRRCACHDVAGSRGGGQLLDSPQGISLARARPSVWMRTAVPNGCADDARERCARRHRFGSKASVAGAILRLPGHNDALCNPDESLALSRPCPWPPAHGSRSTLPTCRWGTAGAPAQLASGSARRSISLSRMWLAAFKMMHRSVGRQGCGQLLAALTASTWTLRSLTVAGPARTSPRPCGHP